MKAYGGSEGIATLLLTSSLDAGEWSTSLLCRFTPGVKSPTVPTGWEARWAPEPIWTLSRSQTPVPTELSVRIENVISEEE
jgi:hypothetical protein